MGIEKKKIKKLVPYSIIAGLFFNSFSSSFSEYGPGDGRLR
jgi:hypothetical protein